MTIEYIVISETPDEAIVEFVDSETQLSSRRSINIRDLDEAGKLDRFESHKRTFTHRLGLGIIKKEESTPDPVADPLATEPTNTKPK